MRRTTWNLLEWLLADALDRRRRLEAETFELDDGEHPAEGDLHAEWAGTLPPEISAADMARALEELRDIEPG